MLYPKLDYGRFARPLFDVDETLAVTALTNSAGLPTMSEEDTKLAILSLINTCKYQQEIINELVDCVNELRTPKPKKKLWHHYRK